jgi:hypothetical protein
MFATHAPTALLRRFLLMALSLGFVLGSLTHAGVRLPLVVTTIDEPTIVPAAIVEAIIALGFAAAAIADLTGQRYARVALRGSLRVGIAGVLLGMFALAIGRGTRTELNDVFHVVALIAMLFSWRLSEQRGGGGMCWSHRSRLNRRAT